MRIAIVSTDNREHFKTYGAAAPDLPTPQRALIQGLARFAEVEVHLVSCLQRPVSSPWKLANNIFCHSLHVRTLGWMRTLYAGCVRAVRRKLREIQPDLVHGQGTERDCAMAAVFSGYPNVLTLHGIMKEQANLLDARFGSFYWFAHRLENFAMHRTLGVFCNSAYTEAEVAPRARRVWRVPNPIREAFFEASTATRDPQRHTLLNIGLVCPRKRQNELILAVRALRETGLDFQLHFLGHASGQDDYSRRFLQLVEQNRHFVSHLGFKAQSEMIQCLDSAAALVHVPTEESFGLVAAEALARNVKFFGSRVGGLVDIAANVEGAELFAPDDWAGLQKALVKWLQAGAPRPTEAARVMRERYHPEVIARRHLEIYDEVLQSRA